MAQFMAVGIIGYKLVFAHLFVRIENISKFDFDLFSAAIGKNRLRATGDKYERSI